LAERLSRPRVISRENSVTLRNITQLRCYKICQETKIGLGKRLFNMRYVLSVAVQNYRPVKKSTFKLWPRKCRHHLLT
jgi:hypothetical protein